MRRYTILGGGLAGISASFHLGHDKCVVFEKNSRYGGHITSYEKDGFTWDQGPHVSFTKDEYVKRLFAQNVQGEFLDYPVETSSYFEGNWIPHPAQSNLWAIPQPLRDKCLHDFVEARRATTQRVDNYGDWLRVAFGNAFAEAFPCKYTEKYWTTSPKRLTTDWVGDRMFYPKIEDVVAGYEKRPIRQTHYITRVRYPTKGGFFSFARKLFENAEILLGKEVVNVSFKDRRIVFSDGVVHEYETLISTLPLPTLIALSEAPADVKCAASHLSCSSALLVNVTAAHETIRGDNWIYVYDDTKYSTRINCTELLSPNNAPVGKTGIQVEVYFSPYKPKTESDSVIARKVVQELIDMGLISGMNTVETIDTKWIPFANVIFDLVRKEALNRVLNFLEENGLVREDDDLEPMTRWDQKGPLKLGSIVLAGRFGQWKYYWTDDCVLRGRSLMDL